MSDPVIALLERVWRSIDELCSELAPEEWDTATDLPGWTVRDNVAHMIGTERMLAGDPAPETEGPVGAHVRNPIGEFNEAWVAHYRNAPGAAVLDEFRRITTERLAALRAMAAADFDRIGFTPEGEGPYRQFMEIRAFDCWEHEQDIRRAVGRPGHLDGPVPEMALAKIAKAAGYVVGKKAAAPDGSSVVFEVRGPVEITVPVVVEGRARVAEEVPAAPTVRLQMDTETYNALGCGRWTGERARAEGRVRIEGDVDLGTRVLDSMAFTI